MLGMRLRCVLAAAAVFLALSSSPAHAEEEWYGYQVAAPDVVGGVLILAGAEAENAGLIALGVSGVLFGGPIVHAAHGNWGRAGVSFGLRVGAPILGASLGAALGSSGGGKGALDAITYGIVGGVLGYVAAAAFDIGYLAREDVSGTAPRMFSIGGRF